MAMALRAAVCVLCLLQGGQAKGMMDIVKGVVCTTVKIKMICGQHGVASSQASMPTATTCSGSSCCQASSCLSDHMPVTGCSRGGAAKCIGNKLPFTRGICQCQYGACTNGRCPSQSGTLGGMDSRIRLFDDSVPEVAQEDGLAKHMSFAFLSAGLLVAGAGFGLRVHRRARGRAAPGDEESFMASAAQE